jgi:hypothetical protein
MNKTKSPLKSFRDERIVELVSKSEHKILGRWAIDCVGRVLLYWEETYPQDYRPRKALETLQIWLETGVFKMAVIRQAALAAHTAARETGEDNAARSAARAAGQAVATAHVASHAEGAAIYALQAIYRASNPRDAEAAIAQEREWQYRHLLELGTRETRG